MTEIMITDPPFLITKYCIILSKYEYVISIWNDIINGSLFYSNIWLYVTIFSNYIISHIEKDCIIVSIVDMKILNCMNIVIIVVMNIVTTFIVFL